MERQREVLESGCEREKNAKEHFDFPAKLGEEASCAASQRHNDSSIDNIMFDAMMAMAVRASR